MLVTVGFGVGGDEPTAWTALEAFNRPPDTTLLEKDDFVSTLLRIKLLIWVALSEGSRALIRAATPATIGVDIEVPSPMA